MKVESITHVELSKWRSGERRIINSLLTAKKYEKEREEALTLWVEGHEKIFEHTGKVFDRELGERELSEEE